MNTRHFYAHAESRWGEHSAKEIGHECYMAYGRDFRAGELNHNKKYAKRKGGSVIKRVLGL